MRALSGVSEVVDASRKVDEEARAMEAVQANYAQRSLNRTPVPSAYSLPTSSNGARRPQVPGQPPSPPPAFAAVLESLASFNHQQLLLIQAEVDRQLTLRGQVQPPAMMVDPAHQQLWQHAQQQQQASDTLLLLRTLQQAQLLRQRSVEEPGPMAAGGVAGPAPLDFLSDWSPHGPGSVPPTAPVGLGPAGSSPPGLPMMPGDIQLPTPFADPVRQALATAQRSTGPGLTKEQLAAIAASIPGPYLEEMPSLGGFGQTHDSSGSVAGGTTTRHSSLCLSEGPSGPEELFAATDAAASAANGQASWGVTGWSARPWQRRLGAPAPITRAAPRTAPHPQQIWQPSPF
ncbi:hypothetical protein QBZ16_004838 [Prototheca wickerhamii]|uniref:Uncharacterized protein n=1 Tax=Prototheca wickerhamii TaxID=3111 RepID=A0AAD9MGM0_PROWI|nr:hypothetical protein QBZ16_004838 [Prototheca wickerhamii]